MIRIDTDAFDAMAVEQQFPHGQMQQVARILVREQSDAGSKGARCACPYECGAPGLTKLICQRLLMPPCQTSGPCRSRVPNSERSKA